MKKNFIKQLLFRYIPIVLGLIVCIFLFLFAIPRPTYTTGFTTLNTLTTYIKTTNENIPMDSENTIKPEFGSYYKTLVPTWKSNIKEKLLWLLGFFKLTNPPQWSASFFKYQLETLASTREAAGYKDSFICKINPTEQTKIVIFGNIQGALHSLTRDLIKLKELNVISNNFKVSNSDNFIIFMGDVVSRSPYSMETLSLVMRLLQANPDNVIYLKGNHETGNYWQEHTLKTELQIRASYLSKQTIPLGKEVNKFFNTLPLALYIPSISNSNEVIRISDSGRSQNELLQETNFAGFLNTTSAKRLETFNLKEKRESFDSAINVKVIFKGEKKRETYQPHTGLRLLEPDMESTAWTILSCPTPTYQKAINFKHDAFVILTPAQNLDDWKITLYNRNVQTQEPFKATTYNLLSGTEEGTTKKVDLTSVSPKQRKSDNKQKQLSSALQPSVSVPQPQQKAPIQHRQTFTVTPTIADHAEEISKHAQEIAKHAQEIAVQLRNQQPADQQKLDQSKHKTDTSDKVVPTSSAFQPIKNTDQDQLTNNITTQ